MCLPLFFLLQKKIEHSRGSLFGFNFRADRVPVRLPLPFPCLSVPSPTELQVKMATAKMSTSGYLSKTNVA